MRTKDDPQPRMTGASLTPALALKHHECCWGKKKKDMEMKAIGQFIDKELLVL